MSELKEADAVRSSLGFTPRKAKSMVEKAAGFRRVPHSADAPKQLASPANKDYRRGSVYVPEARDQLADEQRKLMAMANYARHHPHRRPLHQAKAPRELVFTQIYICTHSSCIHVAWLFNVLRVALPQALYRRQCNVTRQQ